MASMVAQTVAFLLTAALLVPTLAVGLPALLAPSAALGVVTMGVGLASAGVVLVLGVRHGARTYERRLPELLAQVTAFA